MAGCSFHAYAERGGVSAQTTSTDAGGIDGLEQFLLECGGFGIGCSNIERTHERKLGKSRYLIEGAAHANSHHEWRAGVRCFFLYAGKHRIDNALLARIGREHDNTTRVIRAAAFEHHMQTSNTRFIHQAQFAESRRIVARVRTIEQRIAQDRLEQLRVDEAC